MFSFMAMMGIKSAIFGQFHKKVTLPSASVKSPPRQNYYKKNVPECQKLRRPEPEPPKTGGSATHVLYRFIAINCYKLFLGLFCLQGKFPKITIFYTYHQDCRLGCVMLWNFLPSLEIFRIQIRQPTLQ